MVGVNFLNMGSGSPLFLQVQFRLALMLHAIRKPVMWRGECQGSQNQTCRSAPVVGHLGNRRTAAKKRHRFLQFLAQQKKHCACCCLTIRGGVHWLAIFHCPLDTGKKCTSWTPIPSPPPGGGGGGVRGSSRLKKHFPPACEPR